MKRTKIIIAASLLSLSAASHAGLWSTTCHSRANCVGFNESITWYSGHSYYWRVESHHFPEGYSYPAHVLNTGKQYTWRAAAYHTNESWYGRGDRWWVNGFHFYYPYGKEVLNVFTSVGDCSIYDGWWG